MKLRIIDNPSEELKLLQSLIADRLLKPVQLPDNILGGIKGKSVLHNVGIHRESRVLLKIDIAQFFPSINNRHVFAVWKDLLGCSSKISSLLTKLTTFERHLPQGAPSSTLLANLVLYSCDAGVRAECQRLGIRYSSWVDDLVFSSENPRPVIRVVVAALQRKCFRISRKKLEITGPGARKVLNGVLIGRQLSVPPERLSAIRSGIHKLRQGLVPIENSAKYIQSLRGCIAQIASINRARGNDLLRKLEAACAQLKQKIDDETCIGTSDAPNCNPILSV